MNMKKNISDKQFVQAYRSAGLWFVALYMEAFILRFDELQDEIKKMYMITEIYDNGDGPDKDEGGTRTRVNSLLRIIESGRIIEALEVAAESSRLMTDFPNAVRTAIELLNRINNGSFVLPE
jgi:hypothetical protein